MKHFSPRQLAVIDRVAAPFVARSLGRAYTRDMLTFDNRSHEAIPGTRGDAARPRGANAYASRPRQGNPFRDDVEREEINNKTADVRTPLATVSVVE